MSELARVKKIVNNSNSSTPAIVHANFLHGDAQGFVDVPSRLGDKWRSNIVPISKMAEAVEHAAKMDECNCYISMNSFYRNKRGSAEVKQFRAFWADLDCFKFGFTAEQIFLWLMHEYFGSILPVPNLVIFSGQGLQLIWKIAPENGFAKEVWMVVMKWIHQNLQEFGADGKCIDAARVLRLDGTINQANGKRVESVYLTNYVYSLTEVCRDYIPATSIIPAKRLKRSNVRILPTTLNLHQSRATDISKLIRKRAADISACGTENGKWGRETLLFLFRYFRLLATGDPQKTLDETVSLNYEFLNPLEHEELLAATESSEKMFMKVGNPEEEAKALTQGYKGTGYRFTNEKLIQLLDIETAEERELGLSTIISHHEKERRRTETRRTCGRKDRRGGQAPSRTREEYLTEVQAPVKPKVQEVLEMKAQGLTQRKIAKNIGVSVSTVNSYLTGKK